MDNQEMWKIFEESGAALQGHFLLTSGRHSDRYMQCAKLFVYPDKAEKICAALAEKLKGFGIELVAAPAIGGIIMGYEMARQLKVPNVFLERQDGVMTLRRGFTVEPGTKVAVVEDVVTTGGSVREVVEVLKNLGAEVVAVASVVDRSAGKVDFGLPYVSLLSMDITSYEPENCPLCREGKTELVKPGRTGKK